MAKINKLQFGGTTVKENKVKAGRDKEQILSVALNAAKVKSTPLSRLTSVKMQKSKKSY